MKKHLLTVLFIFSFIEVLAYPRLSIVERFTNSQCGPCASINSAWYNSTIAGLLSTQSIAHIVHNVNWPSAVDPMYLLNAVDNASRWTYYGVNAVPWIVVNGATIGTDQSSVVSSVNSGNATSSPFKIVITPEKFSNNIITVKVKIYRDSADATTFTKTILRLGLVERHVVVTPALEPVYYDITRKMLPDGKGTQITVPAAGDSAEYEFLYIPSSQFTASVNLDSLQALAYIQNEDTKYIYQAAVEKFVSATRINAAFGVDETFGANPFTVQFTDYSTSTPSTSVTSWEWDFNNDGVVDATTQNPQWTFTGEQTYNVKLTVSNGTVSHTRLITNFITVIGSSSDILVVNGIDYKTAAYITEMTNFYNNSACFGNHQVDVWDLFGDQGFNYSTNPNIVKKHLYNRTIPLSVLKMYDKVVWIGNNYSGDLAFYSPAQILQYVQEGGNLLLATRTASAFFDAALRNYCGIVSFTGDMTITSILASDDSLVDMTAFSGHSLVHFPTLDTSSQAIAIFDDNTSTPYIAGFRLHKENEGNFVFIAGRPYRYDNTASNTNYNFVLDNWMNSPFVDARENSILPEKFELYQNYPNPFNPSTVISYQLSAPGNVVLKIFDVLGNEVATLIDNEWKEAGFHNYQLSIINYQLPTGIYFYKLQAGEFTSTKKFVLLK